MSKNKNKKIKKPSGDASTVIVTKYIILYSKIYINEIIKIENTEKIISFTNYIES